MRAVCIREPGGVDVLELRDVADPVPGPEELLVRVRAAGLNRADLLQRRGLYPAPDDVPADIPGLEFAGEVEAVGARARLYRPGDRVMGIVGGGACAERLVIHERAALPVPVSLDFSSAAAVPEAFLTAWDALVLQGNLSAGERLLVLAAGSGVGTAAIQLGRYVGAKVLGTARTKEKLDRCGPLGMEAGVLAAKPTFAEEVKRLTGGAGVDLVLDLVGGDWLPEGLAALAPKGRLLLVGLLAGREANVPLGAVLQKRLTIRGTVLRARPIEEKIALVQDVARRVLPGFEAGRLRPVVDVVLPMAQIREAHQRLEGNATFGKIVVEW